MKKVIKDGVIPEAHAKCEVCGCEFIYDRIEVHRSTREGLVVNCPCCSKKIKISKQDAITLKIS